MESSVSDSSIVGRFDASAATFWWVKATTQIPSCMYYFGPFDSRLEAERSQHGFLEDLLQEGAQGVTFDIQPLFSSELPEAITVAEPALSLEP
jgi:hypothetical protein